MRTVVLFFLFSHLLVTCGVSRSLHRSAQKNLLQDSVLQNAHVGISIYEPATGRWWYNWQADKYFVPASNTKIATCYAAMKYLGDSLIGLRYETQNGYTNIHPTGDPTFLHPDFKKQPVYDFLVNTGAVNFPLGHLQDRFTPMGNGWAWNDYAGSYAAERSVMPIYGNVARFFIRGDSLAVVPKIFYNDDIAHTNSMLRNGAERYLRIVRAPEENRFRVLLSPAMSGARTPFAAQEVPFKTIPNPSAKLSDQLIIQLLEDTLHKKIGSWSWVEAKPAFENVIYSQPTDSMLKPMMHRSDNFFAEQALLMVSDKVLGYMNDEKIIDAILKTDFAGLPQPPRWVDGSGLSRYNLFTPQDFVSILQKIHTEFGMNRIREVFPAGGEGTLAHFYKNDTPYFYGKTGTLSGVVALSGYLVTVKGRQLIVSVLVNHHRSAAAAVRQAVERFLQKLQQKY